MSNYDQWKTANPPEFDYDPIAEAEQTIRDVKYALSNWESKPSPAWQGHINRMIHHIEELITYIVNN